MVYFYLNVNDLNIIFSLLILSMFIASCSLLFLRFKESKSDHKNKLVKYFYEIKNSWQLIVTNKKSKHIIDFENKYNVKINDLNNVSKVTNVPTNILKKVINKGMGAYYSSGSRPNQTPHSWGYARLASVLLHL